MSRLQSHRKSQSTSALSVLAETGDKHLPKRRIRASQHPTLGVVEESASAQMARLPGLNTPSSSVMSASGSGSRGSGVMDSAGEVRRRSGFVKGATMEEVRGWLGDILSLRSSERRRMAALRGLEKTLLVCCLNKPERGDIQTSPTESITLRSLIDLSIHTTLINLLTRHAQALSMSRLPEDVQSLVSELSLVVGLLQGVCLLSRDCKAAMGESHILEILIDLLLLLRTQPPLPLTAPVTPSSTPTEPRSIVYSLLDLLCCILVDCPLHARTFERLSGLEAVVRVLKGTGVAKEIRMKCLEFLYFYLLPENSPGSSRAVSAASQASNSSSSSGESLLYPPSPLSSSTSSIGSDGRISPSPLPHTRSARQFTDLDIPFIPQTPKKAPQPSLGYLTPSTHHRRVSGNMSITSTPSLAPVPASPRGNATPGKSVPETPSRRRERDERRWSVMEPTPTVNAGLGLGLPKSSSVSTSLASLATGPSGSSGLSGLTGMKRDVTAIKLDRQLSDDTAYSSTARPTFTDPFGADSRHSSGSSGSSTAVPRHPSGMSRSSTQPSLSIISSSGSGGAGNNSSSRSSSGNGNGSTSGLQRRTSARRKSPLVPLSSTPASPKTNLGPGDSPRVARRESLAPPEREGRPSKMRHSRTQSHLSALPSRELPPVPRVPSVHRPTSFAATPTAAAVPSTPSRRDSTPQPQPTPARRAFPAELTRGLPPSASSPALNRPLGPAKRVSSGSVNGNGTAMAMPPPALVPSGKVVKSVEDKKELLSSWLGNVDALVQGVEKVSFWSNVQKQRKK